jgi:monoterpene epsilon-lactone hydrolase
MASVQSGAVSKLYRIWTGEPPAGDELIRDQRQWDVLTSEPGGVDYLEVDAGGVAAMWVVPKGAVQDRVLLCIHGGGFVSGSIYTHRKMFAHLAKAAGVRALLVGYRLLPEGVYPSPVNEVLDAYRWLLDQGVAPEHIGFTGDSAGGGLSITTQLLAREQGLPLPAAAMPLSPWVDMEVTGESMQTNIDTEALFSQPWVKQLAEGVLAGASPTDPHINPLYADLTGLGPIYIQVGGYEVLLDDSRRLAEHAEKAGVEVQLDIYPEQQHTFQMMAGNAPESDDAIHKHAQWIQPKLGL